MLDSQCLLFADIIVPPSYLYLLEEIARLQWWSELVMLDELYRAIERDTADC